MRRLFYHGLALFSALGVTAAGEWTNRLVIPDRQALASWNCAWTTGATRVQFQSGQHATLEIGLEPGRRPVVQGFPAPLLRQGWDETLQTWPVPLPATNPVPLALRRQSHAWLFYVGEQPVARFPEPWTNELLTIRHPAALLPPAPLRDEYVQRLAAFRFDDTFLVPKTTTNQFPETWERLRGEWHLHSVTGGVSGALAGRQLGRQPTPERSPNFYSLEGTGVVLAGESFRHRYRFRAAVQHNGGTNGLVFLVTETGACHGFTTYTDPASERLVFQLWRGHTATNQPREILATVGTELLAGQWTLLEVQLFDDQVLCRADQVELLRQRLPLPPGGRFGLVADAPQDTRFDDVAVSSHEDYRFENPAELRFHTLQRTGTFRINNSTTLAPPGGVAEAARFRSPGGPAAREWLFGATDDAAHQLECCFRPEPATRCALIAGWLGPARPYYRFSYEKRNGRDEAVLEQIEGDTAVVLDHAELGMTTSAAVRLTLDALRPDELRGLVNGRLVVITRPTIPVQGAGGIRLEGRGEVAFALPRYVSHVPVYTDRFEKNPAYVNDPFMRHWAAPEGQWLTQRDGLTWLRSDILGRAKLHLPVVAASVLHLAIPEGETNGQCLVAISNGLLSVFLPAVSTNAVCSVSTAGLPEQYLENAGNAAIYTVHIEDDVLWLSCLTNILGRAHLPPMRKARRARLEGLTPDQLRRTLVQRENVFDTLFNESLFTWMINGGSWEVVNRFQCEPTWSHMNGENGTSFAALWSKMEMSGDFCVDFFAGTRMGWYDRPGDYNLTVHSQRLFPGDGYTVTLAGWDPDWSQMNTRLFRQGRLEAVSTAYTAPRVREGSVRRGYEPLVTSSSRPVHGAWYGMRFRRVGDELSYQFDNDPVLSWKDPAPLAGGSLGIWTYRNSIMVARVRMAAESVRPRPFRFWNIPAPGADATPATSAAPATPAPPATPATNAPELCVLGRPIEQLVPTLWQDADPVSQPLVRFLAGRGANPGPILHATALEGGGTFLVAPRLPLLPATQLLGWHFEMARHPDARFNFEFSAGTPNKVLPGQLADASASYSFIVCGSAELRGERLLAGRLTHPPPVSAADAAPDQFIWTPVDVWLPVETRKTNIHIRLDGFGNLQPDDLQQGLAGNPPGAWYAIRNFREILARPPVLTGGDPTSLVAVVQEIASRPAGVRHLLRLPAAVDARQPALEWIAPTETDLGLVALPDPQRPDTLRITSSLPYPNALLPPLRALLDEVPLRGVLDGPDYLVLLPRPLPPPTGNNGILRLEFADGQSFQQRLPLNPATTTAVPRLLTCELSNGGTIQTFEDYMPGGRADDASLVNPDPQQGAYLCFRNNGLANNRLSGALLFRQDAETAPLLQFRYRGDRMARGSLALGILNLTFSENFGIPVSANGTTAVLDRAWHTWLGSPFMNLNGTYSLQSGFLGIQPKDVTFASRLRWDQSGRYSTLETDDIVGGPVAGPLLPLTFRPQFTTLPELAEVRYALAPGAEPWSLRTTTNPADLTWHSITNLQPVTPDLSALPEGIHHLCLQARQLLGTWSAVYDIPFLLACRAPQVSATLADATNRYNGTILRIAITSNAAPLVSRNVTWKLRDEPLNLRAAEYGQAICSNGLWILEIDWPLLLRRWLNASTNGELMELAVEGIRDGASNAAPACTIPIRVDYAADRQPPTVRPLALPANVLAWQPQCNTRQNFFQLTANFTLLDPLLEEGYYVQPFLCPTGLASSLSYRGSWNPELFPWLAINLRTTTEREDTKAPFDLQFRFAGPLPTNACKPKTGDLLVCNLTATNIQPFVVGRMDWRSGRWNQLLINVRDLLRDHLQLTNAVPLQECTLAFPARRDFTFQLRSMAILAPWKTNDLIVAKAYDASGIAGITWQDRNTSTNTIFCPAACAVPSDQPPWLTLCVQDRAGNRTPGYLVPLPPATNPVPDTLPATLPLADKDF
jgi:hypothetical protein